MENESHQPKQPAEELSKQAGKPLEKDTAGLTRRGVLKVAWTVPVILAVNPPVNPRMVLAQSAPHSDGSPHSDAPSHTDFHNDGSNHFDNHVDRNIHVDNHIDFSGQFHSDFHTDVSDHIDSHVDESSHGDTHGDQ